jgi:GTP-binding protein HflX
LEELGINQKDTILVLNQIDAVADHVTLDRLKERYPSAVAVSAKTGEGLSRLAAAVSDALTHHFLEVDVEADVANGRLLAALAKHGEILSRTYAEDRVSIHCRMPRKFLGTIAPGEAQIKLRNGKEWKRDGEDTTNGFAYVNGHAHTSGHAGSNGQAHGAA